MNNLLMIIGVGCLLALNSCSEENVNRTDSSFKLSDQETTTVWKLVMMSGSVAGIPPATGNDMEWQEKYILNPDKTFIKSRTIKSNSFEENGTYTKLTLSDGTYLEFSYPSENDLIGNCTSDTKELLKLEENDTKLVGTWWACDGPGLFYEKEL